MRTASSSGASQSGPLDRLAALAPLDGAELAVLAEAARDRRRIPVHREIVGEGRPIAQASILLSGWAYRIRQFADGRRQVLGFLLPGELIGMCRQSRPLASTSILAATEVTLCPAPTSEPGSALAEAYAVSGAIEEHYLMRQIARLGRLNAYERVVDWLLEIRERLAAAGLTQGEYFPVPMTQEVLADALGLTSVHVNRTLQTLRREGVLELRSGTARLNDRERLKSLVEYRPAQVTGE
jgi:CRP-like cAMP-binding protein